MTQGSTPLHTFILPFSTERIRSVRVSYMQAGRLVLSKETEDVSMDGNSIALWLTQEETLKFNPLVTVMIQLQILTTVGNALPSRPIKVPVFALLDKRVIE